MRDRISREWSEQELARKDAKRRRLEERSEARRYESGAEDDPPFRRDAKSRRHDELRAKARRSGPRPTTNPLFQNEFGTDDGFPPPAPIQERMITPYQDLIAQDVMRLPDHHQDVGPDSDNPLGRPHLGRGLLGRAREIVLPVDLPVDPPADASVPVAGPSSPSLFTAYASRQDAPSPPSPPVSP